MTGISPIKSLRFNLNLTTSSSWLTWSHPFENYPLSYHIYIENQHGQLLYNDITNDTSYELYNLTVCDIYTATVIVHSEGYSSNSTSTQDEFSGGIFLFNTIRILTFIYYIEYYVIILSNHAVIFNEHNNSFDIQFQIIVS